MAKIICDNARVATATEDNPRVDIECRKDCPICNGYGYIEAKVVDVVRVKALLKNSRYTKFAVVRAHNMDVIEAMKEFYI